MIERPTRSFEDVLKDHSRSMALAYYIYYHPTQYSPDELIQAQAFLVKNIVDLRGAIQTTTSAPRQDRIDQIAMGIFHLPEVEMIYPPNPDIADQN